MTVEEWQWLVLSAVENTSIASFFTLEKSVKIQPTN